MDDKRLDELLHGLKQDYERLPEFTESVEPDTPHRDDGKGWKRGKFFSYAAMAAGVFLFLVLAVTAIDGEQDSSYSKAYLTDFFEEKKEELRAKLGLESIDAFWATEQAQAYIDHLPEQTRREDIELVMKEIERSFSTPADIIQAMNSGEMEKSWQNFAILFQQAALLSSSLDSHLSDLKVKYQLNRKEQLNLYENQYEYDGPLELVEFLQGIHNEGFHIIRTNFRSGSEFQVKPNYQYFVEKIEDWEGYEGLATYLIFTEEKFDIHYSGMDNRHGIDWFEFDDVLLELEAIYNNYPEARIFLFEDLNMSAATSARIYLHDYISGATYTGLWENVKDRLRDELYAFVENHPDSIYTPIIEEAIALYEENDWEPYSLNELLYDLPDVLYTFLNDDLENEGHVIHLTQWPIYGGGMDLYDLYRESKDISLTRESFSFHYLSLFMYASRVDQELYQEMADERLGIMDIDWVQVYEESVRIYEKQVDLETMEYTFVTEDGDPTAWVELTVDEEGWKVTDLEQYME